MQLGQMRRATQRRQPPRYRLRRCDATGPHIHQSYRSAHEGGRCGRLGPVRTALSTLVGIGLAAVLGCAGAPGRERPVARQTQLARATPDRSSLPSIADVTAWQLLAARPEHAVLGHTEVVRFLVDRAHGHRLYFLDTRRYTSHWMFAREHLSTPEQPVEDEAIWDVREYRVPDRRFVCGRVVRYLDADVHALELSTNDDLDAASLGDTFTAVRAAVYFGEDLVFRPSSDLQARAAARASPPVPVVSTAALFAGERYQAVSPGVAVGFLRVLRDDDQAESETPTPTQIVVCDDVPAGLAVVSGVVTATFQAPLSHASILAQNRGTPFMALRGALDDPRFTALAGQLVRLEIRSQDFQIARATQAQADAAWADRRPETPVQPPFSDRDVGFPEIANVRASDVETVGAKAAQLGEVAALVPAVQTPGGFVVPFHAYLAHLARAGLDRELTAMLADPRFAANLDVRVARLLELVDRVRAAPVDRGLLRQVVRRIRAMPSGRVFLRSSTNAEDLPGFNGAGLYESIAVARDAPPSRIADALREVWASVWTPAAFEERSWYRLDPARVAMAVLVQPAADPALVNGVAVTANPFNPSDPAILINAQAPGASVTGARGGDVPEQYLVHRRGDELFPELLSRSSQNDGAPLLSEDEAVRLATLLARIHDAFVPHWQGRGDGVDVEFFVVGPDRHFVIVQARPYRAPRR